MSNELIRSEYNSHQTITLGHDQSCLPCATYLQVFGLNLPVDLTDSLEDVSQGLFHVDGGRDPAHVLGPPEGVGDNDALRRESP